MSLANAPFGRRSSALAAAGLACPASCGRKADMAGRTIEWIVPFPPGGGTDTWARFHLPSCSATAARPADHRDPQRAGRGRADGHQPVAARAQPDGLMLLPPPLPSSFPSCWETGACATTTPPGRRWSPGPPAGWCMCAPNLACGGPPICRGCGRRAICATAARADHPRSRAGAGLEMLGLDVQIVFGVVSRAVGRVSFERGGCRSTTRPPAPT